MPLQILEPATLEPVTLEEAKSFCDIDHDEKDAEILMYIGAARRYAEKETSRQLCEATLLYSLDNWRASIELPRPPCISITEVSYTTPEGDSEVLDDELYEVQTWTEPAVVRQAYLVTYPAVRCWPNSVQVEYQAGWQHDSTNTWLGPDDLKTAILMLVRHWFNNPSPIITGTIATTVPMSVQSILQQYRWGALYAF